MFHLFNFFFFFLNHKFSLSDLSIFKDFRESYQHRQWAPVTGTVVPTVLSCCKAQGRILFDLTSLRRWMFQATPDVVDGGLRGWYQVPLSGRTEAMLTAWVLDKRLHQSGQAHDSRVRIKHYFLWGLEKRLTLVLLGTRWVGDSLQLCLILCH